MSIGLKYSLIFHVLFILSSFLYISRISDPLSTERVITVDLVNVKSGAVTNLKNSPIQTHDKKSQKYIMDLTKNKPEASVVKKDIKDVKNSLFVQMQKVEHVTHKNKKEVDSKAKKEVDIKINKEVEDILDGLEKNFPSEDSSSLTNENKLGKKNLIMSDKPYDKNLPLTIEEKDNIKMQIERKFFNPIVSDFNSGEIIIKIKLDMQKNGEIEKLIVLNSSSYNRKYSDVFVSLTDSLVRAAHMASPLQGLDESRYEGHNGWKEIELTFDAYYLMHN